MRLAAVSFCCFRLLCSSHSLHHFCMAVTAKTNALCRFLCMYPLQTACSFTTTQDTARLRLCSNFSNCERQKKKKNVGLVTFQHQSLYQQRWTFNIFKCYQRWIIKSNRSLIKHNKTKIWLSHLWISIFTATFLLLLFINAWCNSKITTITAMTAYLRLRQKDFGSSKLVLQSTQCFQR